MSLAPKFSKIFGLHFVGHLVFIIALGFVPFFLVNSGERSIGEGLYYFAQLLGHFGPALVVLYLPFLWLNAKPRPTKRAVLIALVSSFLLTLFLVDILYYLTFRMHLNAAFLWVMTSVDGLRATGLEMKEFFVLVAGFAMLFFAEYFLCRRYWLKPAQKLSVICLALIGLAAVSEKVLYAVYDLREDRQLTRNAPLIPLYQRITMQRAAKKYNFSLQALVEKAAKREEVIAIAKRDLPNILFVAIDSWRHDSLNAENMPNLMRWADANALRFGAHFSGGNSTRDGVFSLFYGAHSHIWQEVLAARRPPKLLEVLRHAGYQLSAFSSSSLDFPEFNKTVFANLPAARIFDHFPEELAYQRDQVAIKTYLAQVRGWQGGPRFDFVFLDGPHNPYTHSLAATKFRPSDKNFFRAAIGDADALTRIYNKYKNSVFQADISLRSLVEATAPDGPLQDTIIVVTGDHGEEFYDYGYWGHFSAFNDAQVKVPLLLRIPGVPAKSITHNTSHVDISPSILTLINPPKQGGATIDKIALLRPDANGVMACGWDKCALIDAAKRIVFGIRPYNSHIFDAYDSRYAYVEKPKIDMGWFLRGVKANINRIH